MLPLERPLPKAGNFLAHDRAHRATHEREVHDADPHRKPLQEPREGENGIAVPGVREGPLEAGRIVGKAERIDRTQLTSHFDGRAFIEQHRGVLPRPHTAVEIARRADIEIPQKLVADVRVPAGLALLPRIGGNLEALASRLSGLLLLPEPGHILVMLALQPSKARPCAQPKVVSRPLRDRSRPAARALRRRFGGGRQPPSS